MLVFWLIFIAESFVTSMFLTEQTTALPESTYLLLIGINTILFVLFASRDKSFKSSRISVYFLLGVVMRLAFLFWVQYFSDILLLPNAGYDEYTFYYRALSIVVNGGSADNYSMIVALEAKLVGTSMLYLRFVNLLISLQAILIFSKILQMLNPSKKIYKRTMMLAWLLPSYALISVLLLRESLIILLIAISLYFFIKWWKYPHPFRILAAIGLSVLAALLHSGAIVIGAGEALILIFSRKSEGMREFRLDKKRVLLLLAVMVVMLSFINIFGSAIGVSSIEDIYDASENRISGGSAYDATIIPVGGIPGILLNSPFHALYFLGSPFPWQWRSLSDILAFSISAVFYLLVLYTTFKTLRRQKDMSLLSALLVIAIIGMIVFGWGVSNAGTALRHRDKLVFVYLMMYALSAESVADGQLEERLE